MELAALSAIALVLGLMIGFVCGRHNSRRMAKTPDIELDYDLSNPINANGHRGEIVNICGQDFVRMN